MMITTKNHTFRRLISFIIYTMLFICKVIFKCQCYKNHFSKNFKAIQSQFYSDYRKFNQRKFVNNRMPKHIYYTTILPLYICIMIIYDCFKSFHMNNTPEDNSGVPAPRKRCILDHPILRGHWSAWRRSGQHWTCGTAAPMHQN